MRKRKKRNISEESYWKTSTDIMAGVLLVILLILMLLLLYLTQIRQADNDNRYNQDNNAAVNDNYYDVQPTTYDDHSYDAIYTVPPRENRSGGNSGGEDDPGEDVPEEVHPDEGHDKCAVLVTVVDEETGNVIKKDGTLFELYAEKNAVGGLQKLHTYYPLKVEYKQYQTTKDGTFYLPEKVPLGWYSLHNLVAPPGYGLAENYDFQINESLDWPEPFLVKIPMSPSKNKIYVRSIDFDTKEKVPNQTYAIYAAENIVTLDGTVRYKSGQKVGQITCDANGFGSSEKLYLGKYYLSQTTTAQYYSRYMSRIDAEVTLTNSEKDAIIISCNKTKADFVLTDEYSGEPVKGAVYSITGKPDVTTDENGKIVISDLDKDKTYTVTLKSVPAPYKIKTDKQEFSVDKDGLIGGEARPVYEQTAYMTRLEVDVKDIIFKNSLTGVEIALLDENDKTVDLWNAYGEERIIEGLAPGTYYLEIGESSSDRIKIDVKDTSALQKSGTFRWTLWDTILILAAAALIAIISFVTVRAVRNRRKKKKDNERQKDTVEEK